MFSNKRVNHYFTIGVLAALSSLAIGGDRIVKNYPLGLSLKVPSECRTSSDHLDHYFKNYRNGFFSDPTSIDQVILFSPEKCKPVLYQQKVISSLLLYKNLPVAESAAWILGELMKENRLTILTPATRKYFGPRWESKNHKGYSILGAYDCKSTHVFLGSDLAPLDLGAVFIHEAEHLTRDKWVLNDTHFVESEDLTEVLKLDEILSTMQAGFFQLSYFPTNTIFNSIDRTMFRPGGDLQGLWEENHFIKTRSKTESFEEFIASISDSNRDQDRLTRILNLVGSQYFPHQPLNTQKTLSILDHWRFEKNRVISPLLSVTKEIISKSSFTADLSNRMKDPSLGCSKISSMISDGSIRGYIGSTLSAKGGDGNRPGGGDGNRPGGGDGNRPGGGDGNRPSSAIRACIRADEAS